MENTGIDLGLWPMYAMLLVAFGFVIKLLSKLGPIPIKRQRTTVPIALNKVEPVQTKPKLRPKKVEVLSKNDWDTICSQAVEQAKNGDNEKEYTSVEKLLIEVHRKR